MASLLLFGHHATMTLWMMTSRLRLLWHTARHIHCVRPTTASLRHQYKSHRPTGDDHQEHQITPGSERSRMTWNVSVWERPLTRCLMNTAKLKIWVYAVKKASSLPSLFLSKNRTLCASTNTPGGCNDLVWLVRLNLIRFLSINNSIFYNICIVSTFIYNAAWEAYVYGSVQETEQYVVKCDLS